VDVNTAMAAPARGRAGLYEQKVGYKQALSSAGAAMGWFTKFCRNAGLMVHNVKNAGDAPQTKKKEVSRQTEEKKLDEKTTLRRTTIDEVEVKRGEKKDKQRPE
jgi:hypothetical protein